MRDKVKPYILIHKFEDKDDFGLWSVDLPQSMGDKIQTYKTGNVITLSNSTINSILKTEMDKLENAYTSFIVVDEEENYLWNAEIIDDIFTDYDTQGYGVRDTKEGIIKEYLEYGGIRSELNT